MEIRKRVTEIPGTGSRIITAKQSDGSFCISVEQFVGEGWCYPWEVGADGWRCSQYCFADTWKEAEQNHNEYTHQVMKAK